MGAPSIPFLALLAGLVPTTPLGVEWRTTTDTLEPANAAAADISSWPVIDLTRPIADGPLAGHKGIIWYAIDVRRPDGNEPLAVVLPPFRVSYEVWIDGEHVGTSGRLPPKPHSARLRHFAYDVPPTAGVGPIRIRVRTYFLGWRAKVHPDGIAIGPRAEIRRIEELMAVRAATEPARLAGWIVSVFLFAVAGVHFLIFLLAREQRVYGWFALTLVALGTNLVHQEAIRSGLITTTPGHVAVNGINLAIAIGAVFRSLELLFEGGRNLARVAYGAAAAILLVAITSAPGVLGTLILLLVIIVGVWIVVRGWRDGDPDAPVMAVGLILTGALFASRYILNLLVASMSYVDTFGFVGRLVVVLAPVAFVISVVLTLARRVRRSIDDLGRAHAASFRFVPVDFLALLGRRDVVEVERGDSASLPMTVLFSDIRGFTKMCEARTPEESFAFINEYLERMEPCIQGNGGFVNQFYGDGILAMFRAPDDAVRAAIAMRNAVEALGGIEVGIGIHTGPLMLGAIGGRERLDTGVIGDAVNLASRVEGMTKQYRCRTLLSGATVDALADRETFSLRAIDRVRAVGREEAIELFQLLDAEDQSSREMITARLADFAKGLADYQRGAFDAARVVFAEMLEHVDDGPSRVLLERCEAAPPAGWDGVTVLSSK